MKKLFMLFLLSTTVLSGFSQSLLKPENDLHLLQNTEMEMSGL